MAQHKLTQAAVARLLRDNIQGRHSDGNCLYLRIRGAAAVPAWVFLYQLPGAGATREMTLGDPRVMALGHARELAARARNDRAAGHDPLAGREARRAAEQAKRAAAKREVEREEHTLCREARRLQELLVGTFKNFKHSQQWLRSLETHVPPAVWHKPIADVTAADLLAFLPALYLKLPETARRVRMRLDSVFDDAVVRALCLHNPAAAIKRTLTKFGGKRQKGCFAAMPYPEVPAFMKRLRAVEGTAARALEFCVIAASRTSEVLGMEWSEVDLQDRIWLVPAGRMKAGEEHTVHLPGRAVEILEAMHGLDQRYVFPSNARAGSPLSGMAMLMVLRRLGLKGKATTHGFRTSFSTWGNESGRYRGDVIEAALAHRERDRVRASYNKALFLAERKQLLNDWAAFISGEMPARVESLKEARAARAGMPSSRKMSLSTA